MEPDVHVGMTANQEVDAETQRLRKRGARLLWIFVGGPFLLLSLIITIFRIYDVFVKGIEVELEETEFMLIFIGWLVLPPFPILIAPLLAMGVWGLLRGGNPLFRDLLRNHRLLLLASIAPPLALAVAFPRLAFGIPHCEDELCLFMNISFFLPVVWLLFSVALIMRYHRFDSELVFRRFMIVMIAAWWTLQVLGFAYPLSLAGHVLMQIALAMVSLLLFAGVFQLPLVLFGVLWVCRRLDRKREQESKERDPAANALIPPESERPALGGKLADFEVVEKP